MTKPLEVKVTLVTLLVCSVKVTKHRPLLVFHTFTCSVACVYCTAVLLSFGFSTSPDAAHVTHFAVVASRHDILSVR